MTTILEIRKLKKNYGKLTAVNEISFKIKQGICFGLLGPNGAGKTTALEVIEGILPPTSGEILYKDKPRFRSFKEEVGIQFQQTSLLAYLTVHETLKTFGTLYSRKNNLEKIIEMCDLHDILDQKNDKVSGGQKQRLLIAIALVNNPDLIFLDEPSTGLDPQARRNLWEIVKTIKGQGKTVVLTTHYMEEAEYLCDEIAILDHGEIIAYGSSEELIKTYCKSTSVLIPMKDIEARISDLPYAYQVVDDQVEIQVDDIKECFNTLMKKDIPLKNVRVHSPNLEDVFLTLTGRKLRE